MTGKFSRHLRRCALGAAALLVAGCAMTAPGLTPASQQGVTIVRQGSFEAGGKVIGEPGGQTLSCDHGHVEYQVPANAASTAVFLWHSSSAAVWQRNWAGGEGFQNMVLRAGYSTYVWDGPRVGRANWGCEPYPYEPVLGRDQGNIGAWRLGPRYGEFFPGVQFPVGDPAALDQAVRARYLEFDTVANAQLETDAAAAALERAGPAVLVTNSAGGFRALLTRLKSDNVKAIVAYENPGYIFPESTQPRLPQGPFGPVYVSDAEFAKLTQIPIQIVWGDNLDKSPDWTNFSKLADAFVRVVNERGGQAEVLHLPEAGLSGNSHIPFADLNNAEVARLFFAYLDENGLR